MQQIADLSKRFQIIVQRRRAGFEHGDIRNVASGCLLV